MKLPKDATVFLSRLFTLDSTLRVATTGPMETEKQTSGSLLERTAKMVLSSDPIEEPPRTGSRWNSLAVKKLFAKLQLLRDRLIPICIGRVQVIKQAASLANHDQQTTPRTVILLIALEMLRQAIDPIRQ